VKDSPDNSLQPAGVSAGSDGLEVGSAGLVPTQDDNPMRSSVRLHTMRIPDQRPQRISSFIAAHYWPPADARHPVFYVSAHV